MAHKLRIAAVGSIIAVAVLVGVVAGAYYAAQQVRPFYRQALEVKPEVLAEGSRELESRATALYSDARKQGQWHALFKADQINGWLATQLSVNQDGEFPSNFRDPRVAISKDALTLGFRTNSGGVETVVTVDASVFLTQEGAVAIRLMSVRAGALPLPVMRLADELAAACSTMSLPVRWTHQRGEPVALVELRSKPGDNEAQFFIDSLELGDGELYVAGHTELTSSPAYRDVLPTESAKAAEPGFAIEDYELRLTPRDGKGALEIARRSSRDESTSASESD